MSFGCYRQRINRAYSSCHVPSRMSSPERRTVDTDVTDRTHLPLLWRNLLKFPFAGSRKWRARVPIGTKSSRLTHASAWSSETISPASNSTVRRWRRSWSRKRQTPTCRAVISWRKSWCDLRHDSPLVVARVLLFDRDVLPCFSRLAWNNRSFVHEDARRDRKRCFDFGDSARREKVAVRRVLEWHCLTNSDNDGGHCSHLR